MKVKDMMRAGFVMNIIALLLIYAGAKFLIPLIL